MRNLLFLLCFFACATTKQVDTDNDWPGVGLFSHEEFAEATVCDHLFVNTSVENDPDSIAIVPNQEWITTEWRVHHPDAILETDEFDIISVKGRRECVCIKCFKKSTCY